MTRQRNSRTNRTDSSMYAKGMLARQGLSISKQVHRAMYSKTFGRTCGEYNFSNSVSDTPTRRWQFEASSLSHSDSETNAGSFGSCIPQKQLFCQDVAESTESRVVNHCGHRAALLQRQALSTFRGHWRMTITDKAVHRAYVDPKFRRKILLIVY